MDVGDLGEEREFVIVASHSNDYDSFIDKASHNA